MEKKTLRKNFKYDMMVNGVGYGLLVGSGTYITFLDTQHLSTSVLFGLIMAGLFCIGLLFVTVIQTLEYKNKYE